MRKYSLFMLTLLMLFCGSSMAQQTPASKQSSPISVVGATAHLGNGKVISNSLLVFENGKITTIEEQTEQSKPVGTIIDAQGKHVYPGFIMPNSTLGLGEIDAVKASVDESDTGEMIPHVRSLIAYNAESKVVESLRPNGVLLAQITPRGNLISGTSSVVQLDAWNWEDAAVKVDDGIHINWPNTFRRGRWWMGEDPGYTPNNNYTETIAKLDDFMRQANAYGKGSKTVKNFPYEAVLGLFDGTKKMYVHANDAREIADAVEFTKKLNIKNLVIVGASEAYKVIDILKKHQIAVLAQRTHSIPSSDDSDYDMPYKLPKLLADAGVLVALENSGGMERMNSRNLPFYAGQVVGQGMEKEQALQLITLNAAKILGIDASYGSLESGKSATFFISEGDALDMKTNVLTHAFIDGRAISLETHQTELYKRYAEKYAND